MLLLSSGESGIKWSVPHCSHSFLLTLDLFLLDKQAFMTVCKYIFYLPSEALYQFLDNGLCELVVCNRASRNICLLDCTLFFSLPLLDSLYFSIPLNILLIS